MNIRTWNPTLGNDWWLKRPGFRRYMLRELSCIPLAAFCALLIVGLYRLGQGEAAWQAFRLALGQPLAIIGQFIVLAFVLYHSATWFALAPRTMPMLVNGKPLPGTLITAAHWLLWLLITVAVIFAIGG